MARRRAAVLGSPIAHSLSPLLHRAAYRALGLDWQYDAIEVSRRGPGRRSWTSLGAEWAGLSLTMPLKEAVLPLLDLADAAGDHAPVRPTPSCFDGGARGRATTPTSPGSLAALAEAGVAAGRARRRARRRGRRPGPRWRRSPPSAATNPTLVVRSAPVATLEAAARLGVRPDPGRLRTRVVLDGAELVISTVPAGAADGFAPHATPGPGAAGRRLRPLADAARRGLRGGGDHGLGHAAAPGGGPGRAHDRAGGAGRAMRAALEGAQALGPLRRRGD